MWLVDLNYIFERDWLIKLSDNKLSNNKLSDNNLASELVGNRTFLNQSWSAEIVIFMIKIDFTEQTNKRLKHIDNFKICPFSNIFLPALHVCYFYT